MEAVAGTTTRVFGGPLGSLCTLNNNTIDTRMVRRVLATSCFSTRLGKPPKWESKVRSGFICRNWTIEHFLMMKFLQTIFPTSSVSLNHLVLLVLLEAFTRHLLKFNLRL
jgi:hypothetical protein